MAHVTIEIELADTPRGVVCWQGGVFVAGAARRFEAPDLDAMLSELRSKIEELTAPPPPPPPKPKPVLVQPAPAPLPRPDEHTARKPRGMRHPTPEPFFPPDAGGSTTAIRR